MALWLPRVLTGAGLVFLALAAVIAITGGIQTSVGPLQISATSWSRVFFEATVLLLLGEIVRVAPKPHRLVILIAVFLIAAAADTDRRRVGDGFEYLGMARNFARGLPPALSAGDFEAVTREMAAHGDRTWDTKPLSWLRGPDGRFDFPHFWLYSLAAAPLVAAVTAAGIHPATAFAILNIALMVGMCWLLVRAGATLTAILFAATMLWWVDKAHAEIFIATLAAAGLLLRATAPAVSLLLLGVVAAQMPALGALLVACVAELFVRHVGATHASPLPRAGARRIVLAGVAALGIAALHPLYYFIRLGFSSPLRETVVPHLPGVRALVTPLVDLNLGVFWFAPVLCALTLGGAVAAIRERAWRSSAPLIIASVVLLLAAAQTPNVNHGGTPGMSRYGVWLLALLLPLAVQGETARRWRPRVSAAAAALTVLFAAFMFPPRMPDGGIRPSPTALAHFVWTHHPGLDDPLPEVFAERVGRVDGPAPVPVATAGCEKVLVVGTGEGALWPDACEPRAVPDRCAVTRALCYVNGAAVVEAPRQSGFSP